MNLNLERPENLRREISLLGLAALVINGLIGAGIFALPGAAAQRTGAFSPAMFVICGLLMSTIVISFGQAASYFRITGGPIVYAQEAFGSMIGFQTGWMLYLGRVTALAANTNALITYAGIFWSALTQGLGRLVAITLVCLFFTSINALGVREGMRTTNILTILKLAPLLLFIGLGISYVQPNLLFNARPPSYDTFGGAILLLVYAFIGFEGAVVPAGESRNPKRDIPRALLATLCVTTLLYVFIQSICISVLPNVAQSERPLADVAEAMVGAPGAWIMALAAFLSIAGNISAIMLAAPRMTYALARNYSLPNFFAMVNERYKTPTWSIIFLGSLGFLLAISGSFVWLAIMSSLTRMLGYGVCIAALPRLKQRFAAHPEALHLPGGLLIPALGLILCSWLAIQAQLDAWIMTAVFVLLGTGLYLLSRRANRL